jgi:hypothetical protein
MFVCSVCNHVIMTELDNPIVKLEQGKKEDV